jgi:hypothetical protein
MRALSGPRSPGRPTSLAKLFSTFGPMPRKDDALANSVLSTAGRIRDQARRLASSTRRRAPAPVLCDR